MKKVLHILLVIMAFCQFLFSQSITKSGGTFASDNSVGSVTWQNPSYADSSDDNRARADVSSSSPSRYLKATNFGFSIPTGAVITGIQLAVERRTYSSTNMIDNSIKIVKGGSIVGDEKAETGIYWPVGTDSTKFYGDSLDLWGVSWSPSDINSSDFGVVVSSKRESGRDRKSVV